MGESGVRGDADSIGDARRVRSGEERQGTGDWEEGVGRLGGEKRRESGDRGEGLEDGAPYQGHGELPRGSDDCKRRRKRSEDCEETLQGRE